MACELLWPDFIEDDLIGKAPPEVLIAFYELAEQRIATQPSVDGTATFEGVTGNHCFYGWIRYVWQDGHPIVSQCHIDYS